MFPLKMPQVYRLFSTVIRLFTLFILVIVLSYLLLSFSPFDPIHLYTNGNVFALSEAQKALLTTQLSLDLSIAQRLWLWLTHLAQGDMGYSSLYQQPVSQVIKEQLPLSLLLVTLSWCISLIFGYLLGLIAGLFQHSWFDKLIQKLTWITVCIPSFWLAVVLISLFSITLNLTPICCAAPIGMQFSEQPFFSMLHHLLLPVATLTIVNIPPIILHTREKVIDVMSSDYVHYSLAHGDNLFHVIRFHVIRNSLLPAIVLQFSTIAELFGGSLIAEKIFNYPGLGASIVNAGLASDTALLMGCTFIFTLFVFIGNLLANLLSRYFMMGNTYE